MAASAAAIALLAFTAGSASADQVGHAFLSSVTGGSTPAGSFDPYGVYVDNSTSASAGDVYVNDEANGVVDKFSPAGAYDCQITGKGSASTSASECDTSATGPGAFEPYNMASEGAVDPTSGDVYVPNLDAKTINEFTPTGAFIQTLTMTVGSDPHAVAVNSAGDLFAAGYLNSAKSKGIFEYNPSTGDWTTFANSLPSGTMGSIYGVAVDNDPVSPSYGDVYVGDYTNKVIYRFSAAGTYQCEITGAGAASTSSSECDTTDPGLPAGKFSSVYNLAVSPTTGELYVADYATGAVDEFSPQGGFEDQLKLPDGGGPEAVAVSASTGDVYAADSVNDQIDVWGPDVPAPVVGAGSSSSLTTSGATLSATVNAEDDTVSSCHFEYATAAQYNPSASNPLGAGSAVPCNPTPSGSSAVTVSASPTGLASGTLYYYAVVVQWSGGGASGTAIGTAETFTTGPVLSGESVSASGPGSVTFSAEIDPSGSDTSYQFQYGTTTSYGSSVPAGPADIGNGTSNVYVSQVASGLSAGTTYHWRVVATSSVGTVYGPDETFTTQACANAQYQTGPGVDLPDCRAYEQVTPQDKGGFSIGLIAGQAPAKLHLAAQLAADGDAIGFDTGTDTFGNAPSNTAPSDAVYLSSRRAGGWSTDNVNPPMNNTGDQNTLFHPGAFSPDLDQFAFQSAPGALTSTAPAGSSSGYSESTATGAFTLLTPTMAPGFTYKNGTPFFFQGYSADGSRVVFQSSAPLTANAPTSPTETGLYEYVNGQDVLLSVLPNGTDPAYPATAGSGGSYTSNSAGGAGSVIGAVSPDGSQVYWTEETEGSSSALGHIFRSTIAGDGTVSSVQVDSSQRATPDPYAAAHPTAETSMSEYWGATPSGAEALFTSPVELTNDANTGSADGGDDLYEFDAATGALTDISVDTNSGDAKGADVQGVDGFSSDGSIVYFVADGVLAAGGQAGEPNLYVWDDGTTTYVATLSTSDTEDWTPLDNNETQQPQVTPSGGDLAFESKAQLTSYNNKGLSEIYRYEESSGALTCVSCDASGQAPTSGASFNSLSAETFNVATGNPQFGNLPSDGTHVFFQDAEPLLPQANPGVLNVYEWEANGTGSCSGSSGCLYLISDGQGSGASYFLDATPSGDDVYFVTADSLVASDTDQLNDIYDAHVGGGVPAPAGAAVCTPGVDCQSTSAAPPAPVSATVSFTGPGNVVSSSGSAKPTTAKIKVTTKAVKGSTFTISVKAPARGRIRITGADVRTVTKAVSKAGRYKLTLKLTAKAKRTLQKKRRLKVTVKVAYKPSSGSSSAASVSIELKA